MEGMNHMRRVLALGLAMLLLTLSAGAETLELCLSNLGEGEWVLDPPFDDEVLTVECWHWQPDCALIPDEEVYQFVFEGVAPGDRTVLLMLMRGDTVYMCADIALMVDENLQPAIYNIVIKPGVYLEEIDDWEEEEVKDWPY